MFCLTGTFPNVRQRTGKTLIVHELRFDVGPVTESPDQKQPSLKLGRRSRLLRTVRRKKNTNKMILRW